MLHIVYRFHVLSQARFWRNEATLKRAKERGFRVTINCTLFNTADASRVAAFFDDVAAHPERIREREMSFGVRIQHDHSKPIFRVGRTPLEKSSATEPLSASTEGRIPRLRRRPFQ
jgi:hypothetical protein